MARFPVGEWSMTSTSISSQIRSLVSMLEGWTVKSSIGTSVLLLIFIVILVSVIALFARRVYQDRLNTGQDFEAALTAARNLGRDDVHRDLVAITLENSALKWHPPEGDKKDWVLAATWTDYKRYEDKKGAACKLTKEVWVTPVPQLQNFCGRLGFGGEKLERRLEQYLGLRSRRGYVMVVELWVSREDIFRPCPDAEIHDRECRPGLPDIPEDADNMDDEMKRALNHARWFKKEFDKWYASSSTSPWTRLGYTYDWGNPASKVGASEYVIREGATVWVGSVTPTDAYCHSGGGVLHRPLEELPKDPDPC